MPSVCMAGRMISSRIARSCGTNAVCWIGAAAIVSILYLSRAMLDRFSAFATSALINPDVCLSGHLQSNPPPDGLPSVFIRFVDKPETYSIVRNHPTGGRQGAILAARSRWPRFRFLKAKSAGPSLTRDSSAGRVGSDFPIQPVEDRHDQHRTAKHPERTEKPEP